MIWFLQCFVLSDHLSSVITLDDLLDHCGEHVGEDCDDEGESKDHDDKARQQFSDILKHSIIIQINVVSYKPST